MSDVCVCMREKGVCVCVCVCVSLTCPFMNVHSVSTVSFQEYAYDMTGEECGPCRPSASYTA